MRISDWSSDVCSSDLLYVKALLDHELVFGLGPAGTGKTYLAVAVAAAMLKARRVDRIILSRPAVEAGERLGFLPGDMKEKVDPYLRPLYDALDDMMPGGQEIGRASCRERGCQDEYISGVAVSFKKHDTKKN